MFPARIAVARVPRGWLSRVMHPGSMGRSSHRHTIAQTDAERREYQREQEQHESEGASVHQGVSSPYALTRQRRTHATYGRGCIICAM